MNISLIDKQCIKRDIKKYLQQEHSQLLDKSVELLTNWVNTPSWESKDKRKSIIKHYPHYDMVLSIYTNVLMSSSMPLISMAQSITISDEMSILDNIKTVTEILVVLVDTAVYDISSSYKSYNITPVLKLPQLLQDRINLSCFVPPKQTVTTVKDNKNIILGSKFNRHNLPLSLDVINAMNNQQYVLDNWFIHNHEKPMFIDDIDKQADENQLIAWNKYQEQFKVFIQYLADNPFYFEHKYDKRGRIYVKGYHFNTQGTSYEKACISLAKYETVTGEL